MNTMNNFEENDIPKYVKKKHSSTSKSNTKSKHKHEYVDCLLVERGSNKPYISSYCHICGKVYNVSMCVEENENGMRTLLSDAEVFEKYKNLEHVKVDNIWNKYIPISKVGD